jgi:hypothetical protein
MGMKFSVSGANKVTGEDVTVVLVATSRNNAEVAATHQGIMVSSVKLLMEEKDTAAISMDDEPTDTIGEAEKGGFWAAAGAKKAEGHGTITLGANSPSDSTHTGAPGTHHTEQVATAMEYHIIMNQALYLLETAVNKYLADGWEPTGGLTVGTSNNAMQYFQALVRKRKPGQELTKHD